MQSRIFGASAKCEYEIRSIGATNGDGIEAQRADDSIDYVSAEGIGEDPPRSLSPRFSKSSANTRATSRNLRGLAHTRTAE